jgi:hypothetical protein
MGMIGAEPLEMTEDNVLAFIERRKYVTFVELHGYFKDFEGDLAYGDLANNVLYWCNMSEKVCEILEALVLAGKIYAKRTVSLTYWADGGGLRIPIAKRIAFKYKKPRWLPIVWNPASLFLEESPETRKAYEKELARKQAAGSLM